MAKGDTCRVSNCNNKITYKGTVCGTHKWRMTKFNSYDLPGYSGVPNYYENFPELPLGIVKICAIHGDLTEDQVYNRYYKNHISSRYCKKCALDNHIKRRYDGMNNLEDYDSMLKKQKNVCAICKKEETTTRNGIVKRFAIDHCHESLAVRGLLCQFCNSALGYFDDNIEILKSAIEYLTNSKST